MANMAAGHDVLGGRDMIGWGAGHDGMGGGEYAGMM